MARALVQPTEGEDHFIVLSTVVMGTTFEGTEEQLRTQRPEWTDAHIAMAKEQGTTNADVSDAFEF